MIEHWSRIKLRHSDPVADRRGTVGTLRTFQGSRSTFFEFVPNREGRERGYVHRESEHFPQLWRNIRPSHFNGHRNWGAGR